MVKQLNKNNNKTKLDSIMPNINIMTNEERIERNAYFIGELALALINEGIKIQYDLLAEVLKKRFSDSFDGTGGGITHAVDCTKGRWKTESRYNEVCKAINEVYRNTKSNEALTKEEYEKIKPIVDKVIRKIEENLA